MKRLVGESAIPMADSLYLLELAAAEEISA
jgi:hypothetical protein